MRLSLCGWPWSKNPFEAMKSEIETLKSCRVEKIKIHNMQYNIT